MGLGISLALLIRRMPGRGGEQHGLARRDLLPVPLLLRVAVEPPDDIHGSAPTCEILGRTGRAADSHWQSVAMMIRQFADGLAAAGGEEFAPMPRRQIRRRPRGSAWVPQAGCENAGLGDESPPSIAAARRS